MVTIRSPCCKAWRTVRIEFFAFLEKRPLTVKLSKCCSESFHRLTDRRVVFKFRQLWPTRNWWNRVLFTGQKQTKFRLPLNFSNSLLRGSRPNNVLSVLQRFEPNKKSWIYADNHELSRNIIDVHITLQTTRFRRVGCINWALACSRLNYTLLLRSRTTDLI